MKNTIQKTNHKNVFVIIPIQNNVAINYKETKMSDNKSKKSKKKTKKKSTKKGVRKKTTCKGRSCKDKVSFGTVSDKATKATKAAKAVVTKKQAEPKVEAKQVSDAPAPKVEHVAVDSVVLEKLKAKFTNLTGYPIRVMCEQKWAHIPPDQHNVARVLYSTALSSNTEGIDIHTHGVNAITGLPTPQEGKFYIVLPEVRFLLPERSDLLTHGELIYDGETNKPLGFKNFFCSATNAKNLVSEELVDASSVK